MRSLGNLGKIDYVEPACHVKSQIEPDGATSLRDVVKQYMSGVQPHDVKACYFDYNILTGAVPNIEEMPEMPAFGSTTECLQFIDAYVHDKKDEISELQKKAAEKKGKSTNPLVNPLAVPPATPPTPSQLPVPNEPNPNQS